jgi:hypothetical protein
MGCALLLQREKTKKQILEELSVPLAAQYSEARIGDGGFGQRALVAPMPQDYAPR